MPTWLAALVTVALFLLCLSATRLGQGWKAWPTSERINYAVLSLAAWPWLTLGFFTTPPAWYTITAVSVFTASIAVFITRQARWLRESRAMLTWASARADELRDQDGTR